MSVFHAGVTDVTNRNVGDLRQLACDPRGIGSRFFDPQEVVFSLAVGIEAKFFSDREVGFVLSQPPAYCRAAVSIRPIRPFSQNDR